MWALADDSVYSHLKKPLLAIHKMPTGASANEHNHKLPTKYIRAIGLDLRQARSRPARPSFSMRISLHNARMLDAMARSFDGWGSSPLMQPGSTRRMTSRRTVKKMLRKATWTTTSMSSMKSNCRMAWIVSVTKCCLIPTRSWTRVSWCAPSSEYSSHLFSVSNKTYYTRIIRMIQPTFQKFIKHSSIVPILLLLFKLLDNRLHLVGTVLSEGNRRLRSIHWHFEDTNIHPRMQAHRHDEHQQW